MLTMIHDLPTSAKVTVGPWSIISSNIKCANFLSTFFRSDDIPFFCKKQHPFNKVVICCIFEGIIK